MIKRLLIAAVLMIVVSSLAFFAPYSVLSYIHDDPSTVSLDSDLRDTETRLAGVDDELAKYSGGAIVALLQMRQQILFTTEDMLLQKRAALVRRIELRYVLDGKVHKPDQARLDDIAADMKVANDDASQSEAEAARYSGGLVQSMALMKAATAKLTVSQLRMSFLFEKYGMPIFPARPSEERPAAANIVPDGDAL